MSEQPKNSVSLRDRKRTKIIATVGPATDSYDAIKQLIANGANGLRLNFSHTTFEQADRWVPWIRRASKELKEPVSVILDLQGPKIRLGDFDGIINVQRGKTYRFSYKADWVGTGVIPTQYDLATKVKRGERLYIYDGKVRMTVTSIKDGILYADAENEGILIQRKGINLPDTDFGGDVITAKDKRDLAYGSRQDIDYVCMSFVQTAADMESMRRLIKNLGMSAKLISKIETQLGVDNIEEIVQASDVVMVARGDLAVETPAESVPIVQRKIIGLGLRYAKPTIVATQMLASMTDAPEPTRAEVSDVATAVLVGADCVMLSEESASGKYPIEAVKVMSRVIRYTEQHAPVKPLFPEYEDRSKQHAISAGIISLADTIEAKAIVAETKSGATMLQIVTRRPDKALIAVTSDDRTAQQLAIVYGVKSYVRPASKFAATKLTDWLRTNNILHKGDVVVTASGQHPGVVGTTDTIKVRQLD